MPVSPTVIIAPTLRAPLRDFAVSRKAVKWMLCCQGDYGLISAREHLY